MTDGKMAEEYVKNNCERWERDCLSVDDIAKENFLAGLKAKTQWHDLRKDPNDLPKENNLYLVFGYTNKREKFYELDVFDPKEEEFLGCGEYVYAWCEIPQF